MVALAPEDQDPSSSAWLHKLQFPIVSDSQGPELGPETGLSLSHSTSFDGSKCHVTAVSSPFSVLGSSLRNPPDVLWSVQLVISICRWGKWRSREVN